MDNQKPVSIGIVMINCFCAVIWNINMIMDFVYSEPNALRIICAIAWDICAVAWILRYRKSKNNEKNV